MSSTSTHGPQTQMTCYASPLNQILILSQTHFIGKYSHNFIILSLMPTIQKLQHNLKQSEKWSQTFKQQIKKLMQEMTSKNQQISKAKKEQVQLNDLIKKSQGELKHLYEDRQRSTYKKDKVQIKVEEMENRLRVYEEAMTKRYECNQQLRRKLRNLEEQMEGQHMQSLQYIFEDVSSSHVSVASFESNKSSKINKREYPSQLDLNLNRIRQLELTHLQLNNRCKKAEEQISRLKKNQAKARDKIKIIAQQHEANDKQNNPMRANMSVQQMSKQTRSTIKRINDLSDRNNQIKQSIQSQRVWINNFIKHLDSLLQCERKTQGIQNEICLIERQAKKQRKTMETIFSFMSY